MGKQIIKNSVIIFCIISALVLLFYFTVGKKESYWVCDKSGVWAKHGNPTHPRPIIPCGNTTPLPKNEKDCLSQDGVWKKQGPEPFESCNRKAVDRGNLCRDNNECEGMCQVELTKEELSQGMREKLNLKKKYGQCSVWVTELGCNGMMQQGKSQVICID